MSCINTTVALTGIKFTEILGEVVIGITNYEIG